MSNDLQKKVDTIRDLLEKSKNQLKMALPNALSVERLLRVSMTTIRQTPELLNCDQKSLIGAIMQAAQLGLEPDGVLGQAYILPYGKEAQFQIGYQGLMQLARRSGEISSLKARVVYENDKFEYEYGLNEKLVHVPARGERGTLKAAYAIVTYKDGGKDFDVMEREDIDKIKKASKSAGSKYSPWQTWEDSMWKKSVIRRICKQLPQATELQRAAAADEYVDLGLEDVRIDEIKMPQAMNTNTNSQENNKPAEESKSDFEVKMNGYREQLGEEGFMNGLGEFGVTDISEIPTSSKNKASKYFEKLVERKGDPVGSNT